MFQAASSWRPRGVLVACRCILSQTSAGARATDPRSTPHHGCAPWRAESATSRRCSASSGCSPIRCSGTRPPSRTRTSPTRRSSLLTRLRLRLRRSLCRSLCPCVAPPCLECRGRVPRAPLARTSRGLHTDEPEAQGSLPPGLHALYVRRTRTSLGRAVRTAYRCTTGAGYMGMFALEHGRCAVSATPQSPALCLLGLAPLALGTWLRPTPWRSGRAAQPGGASHGRLRPGHQPRPK